MQIVEIKLFITSNHNVKKKIILNRKNELTLPLSDKIKRISGIIIDSKGEPIIGANVVQKGTTNGVISDIDGKFMIQVDEGSMLAISYIGYLTKEIRVGNQNDIRIVLTEDTQNLEEVVVVGYGVQKRTSVTGSVAQVGNKELQQAPLPNISQSLAGKLPGLVTRQESGQPGADDASMLIRGVSTWQNSSPMILVDGVERAFNNLDPNEIESIAILKDASAAAIYGVRGANGVILVTTKRGTEQKAEISYSGALTMSTNTAFPDFLDGEEYAYWYNYAEQMNGRDPLFSESDIEKIKNGDPNGYWGNTNWSDLLFKKIALTQHHNISVNGGNKDIRYFLSAGYLDQDGTVKNVNFKRYNLRVNVDANITKDFLVSVDAGGRVEDRKNPGLANFTGRGNESGGNLVNMLMRAHPYINSSASDGTPIASALSVTNPVAARDLSGFNKSNRTVFIGSLSFKYSPSFIKGLSAKVTASYDYTMETTKSFFTPFSLLVFDPRTETSVMKDDVGFGDMSLLTEGYTKQTRVTFQEQVNYANTFGKHDIGVLFVAEQSEYKMNNVGAYIRDFDFNELPELSFGKDNPTKPTGTSQIFPRVGLVARINYAYDQKYLLELSARADASTMFAKENRWGFFPAVSLGWRISEESFIKDRISFLDNLKIRVSTGTLGNDQISPYQYLRMMTIVAPGLTSARPGAIIGGKPVNGLYTANVPNYDITWEKAYNYNIGFESRLWGGLLDVEFDWFYKNTRDILTSVGALYPPSVGGNYPLYSNMGRVDNKGVEVVLGHKYKIGKVTYSVRGNLTWARNRILRIDESPNIPDYRRIIGKSIGLKQGFIAEGLFQTDEEARTSPTWSSTAQAGDIKFCDVNGDGKITYDQDMTIIGRSNIPELMYGLNFEVGWNNFDLSVFFQGAGLNDVALMGDYPGIGWDDTGYTRPFYNNGNTPRYLVQGAWTPTNPNAKYPRLDTQWRANNNPFSSLWVEDGSYLRLKNLQFGYNFPAKWISRSGITRLRLYFAGSNLFTWSKLKYLDPESPDVNNGYYPQQRTYSFGLNLSF